MERVVDYGVLAVISMHRPERIGLGNLLGGKVQLVVGIATEQPARRLLLQDVVRILRYGYGDGTGQGQRSAVQVIPVIVIADSRPGDGPTIGRVRARQCPGGSHDPLPGILLGAQNAIAHGGLQRVETLHACGQADGCVARGQAGVFERWWALLPHGVKQRGKLSRFPG
ncbi:hypothetical protein D9M69_562150 [compost metagenome]